MDNYFATDGNRFAVSVKVTVPAGETSDVVRPGTAYPCKLDSVSGKFAADASGEVSVSVVKSHEQFTVFKDTLSGAGSFILTDVGVWVKSRTGVSNEEAKANMDGVTVYNGTGEDLTVIIDFAY